MIATFIQYNSCRRRAGSLTFRVLSQLYLYSYQIPCTCTRITQVKLACINSVSSSSFTFEGTVFRSTSCRILVVIIASIWDTSTASNKKSNIFCSSLYWYMVYRGRRDAKREGIKCMYPPYSVLAPAHARVVVVRYGGGGT